MSCYEYCLTVRLLFCFRVRIVRCDWKMRSPCPSTQRSFPRSDRRAALRLPKALRRARTAASPGTISTRWATCPGDLCKSEKIPIFEIGSIKRPAIGFPATAMFPTRVISCKTTTTTYSKLKLASNHFFKWIRTLEGAEVLRFWPANF